MSKRLDWIKLKNQFVVGNWLTIADFLRAQNIPNSSRVRSHTKGWKEERLEYQTKIITQVKEKTVETEADVRIRQQRIAQKLQQKGLEKLDKVPVETAEDARKMILTGLQEERNALGLDHKDKQKNYLTQVNVNYPKTKFDELIDGQNLEDILKFLAEVRKERQRRESLKRIEPECDNKVTNQ